MDITLEQAIEIHARALVAQFRVRAPVAARRYAAARHAVGDIEGYDVWHGVAVFAEQMLGLSQAEARAARDTHERDFG